MYACVMLPQILRDAPGCWLAGIKEEGIAQETCLPILAGRASAGVAAEEGLQEGVLEQGCF